MRVQFKEAYLMGSPILVFHYGILELGAPGREPSEGVNLEALTRTMLMERGMRTMRIGQLPALLNITAVMKGNTLTIPWYERGSDEMEMSDVWRALVTEWGAFIAVYLNFCPDDVSIDTLHSMGALTGVMPVQCCRRGK